MRFLTFDYTDTHGNPSSRKAIELSPPQKHHFCIDVGELEDQESVFLQLDLEQAEKEAKEKRDAILAKYDVKKNYRYFNPNNMTNIVEEN